ncbi:Pantoate-beta-alanine ligase [Basidiobolus meristosporus CBS 931.73]|uniref:Pantoate--beta-alanine ligase n=1 Tax=Basidiobolus meristosporus CBS 931.73 TaxID=1314790 RepID=A0A1Y1YZD0_9FUNG|nr:Pantoate-beta-alanine ligase [Basidiobolus meristosporus CBS 931.73]|eukprot:ORY03398.1 Pantoate-beta-alanine ligase [Basidiobolus meristosporus CBS 931.73]
MTNTTASKPLVFYNFADYRAWRQQMNREGKKVGFVPTMGALHAGHLSLVELAKSKTDVVAMSIFVNPAQFAPTEDLDQYPRTLEADVKLLSESGCCDALLVPSVKEMYPSGISLNINEQKGTFVEVLGKSSQMEGSIRPHFFRGVATVVLKLFNIIQPDMAFFGQKDAQQCVVVRTMITDLCLPIEMVAAPIKREEDGMALSSRNRYLSTEERSYAIILYKALTAAADAYASGIKDCKKLIQIAEDVVRSEPRATLDYISIAHPYELQELDTVDKDGAILSGAIRVGGTRLIDNILLDCQL